MPAAPKFVNCPAHGCVYKFRVTDVLIDQFVTCPQCGFSFHMPDPEDSTAMAEYQAVVDENKNKAAKAEEEKRFAQSAAAEGLDFDRAAPADETTAAPSREAAAAALKRLDKLPQRIERAKFVMEARLEGETTVIVDLVGTVDPHEAMLLEAYLKACIQTYPKRMIVNLLGMKAAHSSGIGALMSAIDKGAAIGCTVVFAGVQPAVKFVLETLGLTETMKAYATVADAIAT